MPYTQEDERGALNKPTDTVKLALSERGYRADDACLTLTRIAAGYVTFHGTRWANFETAESILTAALGELRRIKDWYEDIKREENGDVPELAELRRRVALLEEESLG